MYKRFRIHIRHRKFPIMSSLVRYHRDGDIGILTLDNPPVNALSPGVPEAFAAALDQLEKDDAAIAGVVVAAGKMFSAGADINEFAAAMAEGKVGGPNLHGLLVRFDDCPKPIVMAMHGTAVGGGCELSMAGHYRVASPDTSIGQPEANLGIIPGAEGTQRLPRLVGIAKAIDLCVTGKPIKAAEAKEIGLIDAVIEGDLLEGAKAFAREKAAHGGPFPKTRERNDKLGTPAENAPLFAAGRVQAAKIRRNQQAPLWTLEAIEAAATLPYDEAWKVERELSNQALISVQAKALIHAFLAERGVAKVPDVPKGTEPYPLRKIAIIGAGTMGGGIAMALANAGVTVLLKDSTQEALDRGLAGIRRNYDATVQRGRLTPAEVEQRLALIQPQLSYDGFNEVDMVIEAAFESMAVKKSIFGELGGVTSKECVMASNTSTLDIDQIAAVTPRPEMVIGTHFFAPAHIMRLLEIVRGKQTSPRVIATALALAKLLRKVGVVVGNCRGFVGNRMMFPYMREAQFLLEEGATPEQVDGALYRWGMAMGILAVDDMAGIDVAWRVRQEYKHLEKPGIRQPLVLEKLYAANRLGQKTGAGWFRYDEQRKPASDPEVNTLIVETAKAAGIEQRSISDDEIVDRCVLAMVNEGARILEEGAAARAADIDTIYLNGYGFPSYRGGPMWYADSVGLPKVLARIEEFHRVHGELWEPAPLLVRLAKEGKTLAQWDAGREN
jgi:3-hydroxyacyl-CoA dehydrogenase